MILREKIKIIVANDLYDTSIFEYATIKKVKINEIGESDKNKSKFVPEGVEGFVKYKGRVDKIFGFFFGIVRTYIMFIFIFSAINSFFDYKHWPIDTEKSITFPFIQKGYSILLEEIPDEDEYEDAKDKIQEL